jgi:hypothetical protein
MDPGLPFPRRCLRLGCSYPIIGRPAPAPARLRSTETASRGPARGLVSPSGVWGRRQHRPGWSHRLALPNAGSEASLG